MARLVLHDVDVEWLCAGIVRQCGFELSFHDKQDLRQHLLIEAYLLSLKYEPGRIRHGFRKFAALTLRKRVIDWQRQQNGGRTVWKFKDRVHIRTPPQFVPLDSDSDQLELALVERGGDSEADRDEAYRRLLASRDRSRTRDIAAIRHRRAR